MVSLLFIAGVIAASAALPGWMENVVGGSAMEGALYRVMQVPGVSVLFRRPPAEARPALAELIHQAPNDSELYSLRALEDEQALDFDAAEADWKLYVQKAADPIAAQLSLADFYARRLRPTDQIAALAVVAKTPAPAAEKLTIPAEQRSWKAFEQIFAVIKTHGLPRDVSITHYRAWIARYPAEKSLYARYFEFLLAQKDFKTAQQLIADYTKAFPSDEIFAVKARALLDYRQGSVEQGIAVYDKAFQPLWPAELVQSFFDLLRQTHRERQFLDRARAALAANPDDLNAVARVFYYYQQQGKADVARQTINEYRLHKEERNAAWSSEELYTLARLLDGIQAYPDAARYYYALYNSKGTNDAPERALAGLTNILLTAPEQPIRFGSGELSMYSDIATMDTGPGFLNGILSLILNTTSPQQQYSMEERRAVPYFHRARAAELLALFDSRFPKSARRAELHAKLIEVYSVYGESEAVIRSGREFLAAFADAPQRTHVALLMADAFARTNKPQEEFAIYDALLQELAAKADGVPLGAKAENFSGYQVAESQPSAEAGEMGAEGEGEGEGEGEEAPSARAQQRRQAVRRAFSVAPAAATAQEGVRSPECARVLERYLSRLVAMKQVPQALVVLRRELDHNPNDPGLYERLAQFLDQNQLGAEQEQVYRRAIQQFPDRSWYHKLARWYLRNKKNAEFEKLTREVTNIFAGTELQQYFRDVVAGAPQLYLRLNQYAHQRFPHNLSFVRNLLGAYHTKATYDHAAWELLLRQHWFEADDLRNQFFEYLSHTGKLNAELQSIRNGPQAQKWPELARQNPAEANFAAEATMWQAHFEESAPVLGALAAQYPADLTLGRKASSVYRSLVYFDPRNTESAVAIERNLLQYDPGSRDTLARIGDIYADRELLARADPFWRRMAEVQPGDARGYLDAATVFWDYFKFDDALALLEQGRRKLGDPNLYAYEAGAIYENKHDYPRAVAEYVKGALAGGDSRSEQRLLELARRPAVRPAIEEATARLTTADDPPIADIRLRMAVLEAENRKADLEKMLVAVVDRSKSFDALEDVEAMAQQKSLESVRQHALERQAVITSDPVRRLELRYALVRFYEGRKDFESARRNAEALYQENPKILGVVRATVDFYWRAKMQSPAIEVLLQAAGNAYPDLKKQFTFEAARKSTEAGQYQRARSLLAPLLQASPYDGSYLAALADTYAREGDDRGLRDFYVAKIEEFRKAGFAEPERVLRIAALRRGLIPALTRLKDYAGAVDQYIKIINRYPEDEGLTTEAALYAQRYSRQQQLLAFYNKTVADSPRDYRWSVVLARLQTNFENYPAAIDAYSKSVGIRSDRVDLRTARAALAERLMRFDDAIADYEKLYELSYHDAKWMEKVAETRARQGKTAEVVQALKTALIEGRPENANNFFEVARRLESWGMLPQAREFAQQGVNTAGDNLLAVADHHSGAQIYVRVLTRLRQQDAAYNRLNTALQATSSPVSMKTIAQQVEKHGIAAVTDEEWRKRQQETRRATARSGMRTALKEMGDTVTRYFTPEEKSAFAAFVEPKRAGMDLDSVATLLVPWVEAAGIPELEARWRYELMIAGWQKYGGGQMQPLFEMQRRRLKFSEAGQQLETYANILPREHRYVVLQRAAEAYRSGGNVPGELRALTTLGSLGSLGGDWEQRYYQLLLAYQPQLLVTLAGQGPPGVPDKVANFVIANGDDKLALATVAARSRVLPPVWNRAYTGLAGLYFRDSGPEIEAAFVAALGKGTIGERLGAPALDRKQQLAGDIWFYYGSRYGEYRSIAHTGDPEDYLPAMLEHTSSRSSAYFTLAEFYAESGDSAKALADYEHTLELDSKRADVRDRMAVLFWKDGKRPEAIAQWKQVLAILDKQLNSRKVPESFWTNFTSTIGHLGERGLTAEFRPETDALLRTYVRRNGQWRSVPLLRAAFRAVKDPAEGSAWLLDLASVAPEPQPLIASLADSSWIPLAQREPFLRRLLELAQQRMSKSEGVEREYAHESLGELQLRWITYLVKTRQFQRAQDTLDALSKETKSSTASLAPLQLRVAAELGTLDRLLEKYHSDPDQAPPIAALRNGAKALQEAGNKAAARKILEFVFSRELEQHRLNAANFLGLAEIRLDTGDTAGAIELLRRMTLVVGGPFDNLDSAAALLVKTGHPAEALEFLEQLGKAVPWNTSYRVRLAQAQIQAARNVEPARESLVKAAASADVPYAIRTQAAMALAGSRPQADLHSAELKLVASAGPISPAEADKPYFYPARVKAAEKEATPATQVQLLRGALQFWPRENPDPARLALFKSAVAAESYQLALATMEPLLETGLLRSRTAAGEDASDEYEDYALRSSVNRVPAAERAAIASSVALSLEKTGQLALAVRYLRTAVQLESSAARRTALKNRLAELNSVLQRKSRNAARQPVIHEALEQDRIVRPRLVRAAPPPAKPAVKPASRGGKKKT